MPSRKRANWRHPVVYDDDGAGGVRGRRTTRAATGQKRSSSGSRSQSSLLSNSGFSSGTRRERDGTIINISTSRKRTKAWVEVHRPPTPGIRFTVPMWIPVDELTAMEREKYLPESKKEQELEESDTDGETDDQREASDAIITKTITTTAATTALSSVERVDVDEHVQAELPPATITETTTTAVERMDLQESAQAELVPATLGPVTASSQIPRVNLNDALVAGDDASSLLLQQPDNDTRQNTDSIEATDAINFFPSDIGDW